MKNRHLIGGAALVAGLTVALPNAAQSQRFVSENQTYVTSRGGYSTYYSSPRSTSWYTDPYYSPYYQYSPYRYSGSYTYPRWSSSNYPGYSYYYDRHYRRPGSGQIGINPRWYPGYGYVYW
jgi:hypothetical protein